MKIGILTIQKPPENYGASLQCYALWRYLSSQGHQCEVIDLYRPWHPEYRRGKRDPARGFSLRRMLSSLGFGKNRKPAMLRNARYKAFEQFNDRIDYSAPYRSVDAIYAAPPRYDVYISGSDQIWNPDMPVVNEPYFLTFAPQGSKRIAYASSFGVDSLDKPTQERYAEWLAAYDHIAVREQSGVAIIDSMGCGLKARQVLDPSFLLKPEQWEEVSVSPEVSEPYVFVYTLHPQREVEAYIRAVAQKNGLEVRMVISDTSATVPSDFIALSDIGPQQWLGYVSSASMVVTDSFHCTVFSILFGRPFKTVCTNAKVSSRLSGLLELLHLTDNLVDAGSLDRQELRIPEIDYPTVDALLEKERESSCEYLHHALK